MRRLFIIIILTATCLHASAFGVRTEYDYGFASLIASTYKAAGAIEDMSGKSLEQIVKEYRSASIATVGIWATKYADRKAMKDAGLLGTQENYYYRHIRYMVEKLIIPRIYCIGKFCLKYPDKAIYWGPFILDAMKKTKESCMQFQSLVCNGRLSFEDIAFPCFDERLEKIFDLAKLGNTDWTQLFEELGDFGEDFTLDDLLGDFKNAFPDIRRNITTAGSESLFRHFEEQPQKLDDILNSFKDTFNDVADGSVFRNTLESVIGNLEDSLAVTKMFKMSDYDIDHYLSDYLSNSGTMFYTQRWYIYWQDSPLNGGGREEIYEEVFDSRTMDENVFTSQLEERRKGYEKDDDYAKTGRVFLIGKDAKKPYTVADEATVHGAAAATFLVTCHDEREISKGYFDFKVNEHFDESKMNDYAYPNTGVGEKEPQDLSEAEEKMEELEGKMEDCKAQINAMQEEIDKLKARIDTCTNRTLKSQLSGEYSELLYDRMNLEDEYDEYKRQYTEIETAIEEYLIDYDEELDGPYRIVTVKNDLAHGFRIHWDDEGSWSGNTYTCYGKVVGSDVRLRFTAEVSKKRREYWFWFIRYHRAIVGVDWKLVSEEESSDVVETMPIRTDMSDAEISRAINDKRSEIQFLYPNCDVTVSLSYKEPPEKESDDEALHLLWPSDRLAVARLLDEQLVTLNSRLARLEKWLYETDSVLDILKRELWDNVRRTRYHRTWDIVLNRWMTNGRNATPRYY